MKKATIKILGFSIVSFALVFLFMGLMERTFTAFSEMPLLSCLFVGLETIAIVSIYNILANSVITYLEGDEK